MCMYSMSILLQLFPVYFQVRRSLTQQNTKQSKYRIQILPFVTTVTDSRRNKITLHPFLCPSPKVVLSVYLFLTLPLCVHRCECWCVCERESESERKKSDDLDNHGNIKCLPKWWEFLCAALCVYPGIQDYQTDVQYCAWISRVTSA